MKPINALRDIDEANCGALLESCRYYIQEYARDRMTVYFSLTVNSEGTTYATALDFVHGKKSLKHGYHLVMLQGCHQRRSLEILIDENSVEWAADLLHVCHASWNDTKPVRKLRR